MNLQNRLSINVSVFLFKLYRVGKIILGNNPFVINISKYFWNLIRSLTFKGLIFVSPVIMQLDLSCDNWVTIGRISSLNSPRTVLLSLFWVACRYWLALSCCLAPHVRYRWIGPPILWNHYITDALYMYIHPSGKLLILHVHCRIWRDLSAYSQECEKAIRSSHVSCRHIAKKCMLCSASRAKYTISESNFTFILWIFRLNTEKVSLKFWGAMVSTLSIATYLQSFEETIGPFSPRRG